MQTDKKNALSYDSPEYIIRQRRLLLQQNGNTFFHAHQKPSHPIPSIKSTKFIHTDMKFGISKDSPFHNSYTEYNPLTPQMFRSKVPIPSFVRESLSSMPRYKLVQETNGKIKKDNLFMRMLNSSSSKDLTLKDSFASKENLDNLCSNTKADTFQGYKCRLFDYKRSFSSCTHLSRRLSDGGYNLLLAIEKALQKLLSPQ
jgi:hypothetical protein